ncbi:MobF family relaxase [Methylocapsa palsarum]|uniref:AAA domain-containing protein n=1 Tax=Methylocapsa palsarum TaxID=1612308 RepID=A0A1I4CKN7_9HYPH|nr:MobF family relaxase [Methylocapsa palsarum]SFK80849.1 AAA domain-containing protein [Methylocapsa palsarum]
MLNFGKVAAACEGEHVRKYMTQDAPEPADEDGPIGLAGRALESGEKLTAYYTGRDERASWRPDMPASVAAALGIDPRTPPKDAALDRLFEARRASDGEAWSTHQRKVSGFDFVFSPHKSVSLAAEFAATPSEAAAIRTALIEANDEALRYAAYDLAWARKGHAGEKGSDHGEIGWVTFCHDAARPTLAVQDGPDGGTYLTEAPTAGDPHYHMHNFIPNLVVTLDGRVGSIDARALTADKVHEYGAYFQAQLAGRLRKLGARTGYDDEEQAVVLPDIPDAAVALFSKRDRQVIGDAKRYARENNIDWDDLSFERKKQLLHEASAAGRLGKTKEDAREVWRAQAAGIGWRHETVLNLASQPILSENDRRNAAYDCAARSLAKEFVTAAVVDDDKLRVHAARGLIAAGVDGGRKDVDAVVALLEERGVERFGVRVDLIKGMMGGKLKVTHAEQIQIEKSLSAKARQAAADMSDVLSVSQIKRAMDDAMRCDPGVKFTQEQQAAIYALGRGGKLSLLTGVAGAGKTTLLTPLVRAWQATGHNVVGMSQAWRQADALREPGINETYALQTLLDRIETGEFIATSKTVLVVDEVSQIGPRSMLKLLQVQAETGMTIKLLGDREQVQSIEAGDTIELLRRVLPHFAQPEILTALRQKDSHHREIAALFRDGNAAEAFALKRDDGTAKLVEGDYDQVVNAIADLYISRADALQAIDPHLGVTVTTLTNAEAADISKAIRVQLKERGQIGADETLNKAVFYRGEKAELFDLPIAAGDKLRLYRKTMALFDGRLGSIGNNGDIVEVLGQSAAGLVLRNDRGQVAEVEWRRVADRKTGRLLLGFGRAFTIDAAQGMSTNGEHINALPRGTSSATAFKTYTGESRATGQTHTMISKAAVNAAVKRRQALGDVTPITDADLWNRVAEDTSAKPYKALAIDLVVKARKNKEATVDGGLSSHNCIETAVLKYPDVAETIRTTVELAVLRDYLVRNREIIEDLLQRCASTLQDASKAAVEHFNNLKGAKLPNSSDGGAGIEPDDPATVERPRRLPSPQV